MFEISIAVFVYVCMICFMMGILVFFIIFSVLELRKIREIEREADIKRLEYLILKYITENEENKDDIK